MVQNLLNGNENSAKDMINQEDNYQISETGRFDEPYFLKYLCQFKVRRIIFKKFNL